MRHIVIRTAIRASLILPLVAFATIKDSLADIIPDGSTGSTGSTTPIEAVANTYEISEGYGTLKGTNLFHSFSTFNVEDQHTANFSGPTNVENIVARVTGPDASEIYGSLSSSIEGANLYLINPNGIMFGANASLNITGSFYASTANQLVFDTNQNDVLNMDVGDVNFSSAPIAAFGFTQANPAGISATNTTLSVGTEKSISIIAGDIALNNASLKTVDGIIQIASLASSAVVPDDISKMQNNNASNMGAILMTSGAVLSTNGPSSGKIVIRGGTLSMDQSSITNHLGVELDNTPGAKEINIDITGDMLMDNASTILSYTRPTTTGQSAGIHIATDNLTLKNSSGIKSNVSSRLTSANQAYDEGEINITATHTIDIRGHSIVSKTNQGLIPSANISLTAEKLSLSDYGRIDTTGTGTSGADAGDILITAKNINITGDATTYNSGSLTGIVANGASSGGRGGHVGINTDEISIQDNGVIRSYNYSDQTASDITINASNKVNILHGGEISKFNNGTGAGGDINIFANEIRLIGAIPGDEISFNRYSLISNFTTTSASTSGNINLHADRFTMLDGAKIKLESGQNQNGAGNIIINAQDITVAGLNQEIYDFDLLHGEAEKVAIGRARTSIESSLDNPESIELGDNIDSGGNVIFTGEDISIVSFASVSTKFNGFVNRAGNISMDASRIAISSNSNISTESSLTPINAPTGNIDINAKDNLVISRSQISTKINSESGSGGNINLAANDLVLLDSKIDTSTNIGNGGNVRITAVRSIITPNTSIDTSTTLGIAGQIEYLSYLDTPNLLNLGLEKKHDTVTTKLNNCSVDSGENSSLFVYSNINALPRQQLESSFNYAFSGTRNFLKKTAEFNPVYAPHIKPNEDIYTMQSQPCKG